MYRNQKIKEVKKSSEKFPFPVIRRIQCKNSREYERYSAAFDSWCL